MYAINKMILMGLLSSMSLMFCMQSENSLDGTLMNVYDDNTRWVDLSVQGEKRLGCKGSKGLPKKIYKFFTKENLTQDTLVYMPILTFTLGAEKGDGKDIMAFLLYQKALRNDHKKLKNMNKIVFPRLVAHRITCFMLPDQINETVIIKNSKLSGLKKKVENNFQNKEDLNINSVFAMKIMKNGSDVKLITL